MKDYQKTTLEYYEKNKDSFIEGTIASDMTLFYEKFESLLVDDAHILDLGCGSGRDAKHFIDKGYKVEAVDGSQALCDSASEYIGQEVKCVLFEELEYMEEFDAVWACASLLHVSKNELPAIIRKIHQSLKQGGIFFTCFKYGNHEYVKDGRFFNNYDEESVKQIVGPEAGFEVIDVFISGDVRDDRRDERWVNVVARKI
jgi:SAM-dependent methyltransferase